MLIKNTKLYDVLKYAQRIFIPAVAALYLSLGSIWVGIIYLPYPEQVAATLAAVDVFLAAILEISNKNHNAE